MGDTGGGGFACSGGWCSLMTHSAGSVTTQSIALKYVMASEPYRYTWYLKQVMAYLLLKTLTALKVKCFELDLNFLWFTTKLDFSKIIFCSTTFQSQCTDHPVYKIWLKIQSYVMLFVSLSVGEKNMFWLLKNVCTSVQFANIGNNRSIRGSYKDFVDVLSINVQ